MQTHIFDAWEFDRPDSEETVQFSFARKSEIGSIAEFLRACPREPQLPWQPLTTSRPMADFQRFHHAKIALDRFGCSPEPLSRTKIIAMLSDDWNDLEVLLESDERFFWFHWFITA